VLADERVDEHPDAGYVDEQPSLPKPAQDQIRHRPKLPIIDD
jgi:hypothetical protein